MSTLLLALVVAARPTPVQETSAAREQARQCVSEPDAAGIDACRRALALGVDREHAMVLDGVLAAKLGELGRWDEAAAALEAWCDLAPTDAEPRRRLADVLLFGLGRPEAAVARLQEAVRLAPDDAAIWGALGVALAGAERYPEATEAFDAAERLDPAFFALRPGANAVAKAARARSAWPSR
jgi:tetratricopeptide (TPR) repeat protein